MGSKAPYGWAIEGKGRASCRKLKRDRPVKIAMLTHWPRALDQWYSAESPYFKSSEFSLIRAFEGLKCTLELADHGIFAMALGLNFWLAGPRFLARALALCDR